MRRIRVIPVLLINNGGLIKSVKFKNYKYVGDPINAVKIFNEKEVDEICILDISATREKRGPSIASISEIVSEAFMPLSYGGGVSSLEEVEKLFFNGIEKITINSAFYSNPHLVTQVADKFGRQAVTVAIDFAKTWLGKYQVYTHNGREKISINPWDAAAKAEDSGAGEIFLNSIDNDGTYSGYNLEVIEKVVRKIEIPVVVCGGAGDLTDFRKAIDAGASAVAAGSMFVFQRPNQAVLISYPSQEDLNKYLY